jgi:hypothetical protein
MSLIGLVALVLSTVTYFTFDHSQDEQRASNKLKPAKGFISSNNSDIG